MTEKIERTDIQFSYFRLIKQPVNESPKGVMVMHVPTGNTAMCSEHDHRIPNRQSAIRELYTKMGVPFEEWERSKKCVTCGHQLTPALNGWEVDYSYSLKVNDAVLQVYELTNEEESGWTWTGDAGDYVEEDGATYETAAGAAEAAVAWANSLPTEPTEDEDNAKEQK